MLKAAAKLPFFVAMYCEILPLVLIRVSGLPLPPEQASFFQAEIILQEKKTLEANVQIAENQVIEYLSQQLALLPESTHRTFYYNLRKAFFNHRESQVSKLLDGWMSGELPVILQIWKKAKADLSDFFQRIEKAYQDQTNYEYAVVQHFAHSDDFQRSLLFSSHELLHALAKFSGKSILDWDKKDRQIAFSLLEYWQRGQYKTSPFSRLTTLYLHQMNRPEDMTSSDETGFLMPDQKIAITPNVAMLPLLYEVLLTDTLFCRSLSLRLNPSIQKTENQYVWLYFDGDQEAFQETEITQALTCVYQIFAPKPLSYPDTLTKLGAYIDHEESALQRFVHELIDLGFLEWVLPEKGLSSSWCSVLYQYLGFLPASPVISETAYFLHWLRNAARSLPYQTISEAIHTQREAFDLLRQHVNKYGVSCHGFRPEQMFYEDVHTEVVMDISNHDVQNWVQQLSAWLEKQQFIPSSGMREQINKAGFAQLKPGESIDFLRFDPAFHVKNEADEDTKYKNPRTLPSALGAGLSIYATGAVVNTLFPGGGKLMSRWMHLFPAYVRDELLKWPDSEAILFPWQGWSNANFQASSDHVILEVPDGKTEGRKRHITLNDIEVYRHPKSGLQLREKNTHQVIRFVDLGLEAPEMRPPMMQVLWHLGVPDVSWKSILRQIRVWERVDDYCFTSQRIDYQNITLSRKAWVLKIEAIKMIWENKQSPLMLNLRFNHFLQEKGIPRRFFAQFSGEKPQFFDRDSTLSMALLIKKIIHTATGLLYVEEMFPLPENWAVRRDGAKRAAEIIVEWKR